MKTIKMFGIILFVLVSSNTVLAQTLYSNWSRDSIYTVENQWLIIKSTYDTLLSKDGMTAELTPSGLKNIIYTEEHYRVIEKRQICFLPLPLLDIRCSEIMRLVNGYEVARPYENKLKWVPVTRFYEREYSYNGEEIEEKFQIDILRTAGVSFSYLFLLYIFIYHTGQLMIEAKIRRNKLIIFIISFLILIFITNILLPLMGLPYFSYFPNWVTIPNIGMVIISFFVLWSKWRKNKKQERMI